MNTVNGVLTYKVGEDNEPSNWWLNPLINKIIRVDPDANLTTTVTRETESPRIRHWLNPETVSPQLRMCNNWIMQMDHGEFGRFEDVLVLPATERQYAMEECFEK